jgi:phosphatidylglycerophosphate synthase
LDWQAQWPFQSSGEELEVQRLKDAFGLRWATKSIEELRQICQSQAVLETNSWYAVHVARRISIYITWLLLPTGISANQVTVLFFLTGLAAGILFLPGLPGFTLAGALTLQLWFVLDHVDGEIARYRENTTITGILFDNASHFVVHPFIFATLTLGVFRNLHSIDVLILGFLATIFIQALVFVWWYGDQMAAHDAIKNLFQANLNGSLDKNRSISKVESKAVKNKSLSQRAASRILRALQVICTYPPIMNFILLASLANMFWPIFSLGRFEVTSMYLLLAFYSIMLPSLTFVMLWRKVSLGSADRLYEQFLKMAEQVPAETKK